MSAHLVLVCDVRECGRVFQCRPAPMKQVREMAHRHDGWVRRGRFDLCAEHAEVEVSLDGRLLA